MSEPVAAVALALPSHSAVGAAEAATRSADALQFEQALQRTDQASAAQYLRAPAATDASLPEQLLAYVDNFDAKFETTLDRNISDVATMDFSDPMSIVQVMQMQADMFAVTMELELATKLADSGRHFTATLFNNQG